MTEKKRTRNDKSRRRLERRGITMKCKTKVTVLRKLKLVVTDVP